MFIITFQNKDPFKPTGFIRDHLAHNPFVYNREQARGYFVRSELDEAVSYLQEHRPEMIYHGISIHGGEIEKLWRIKELLAKITLTDIDVVNQRKENVCMDGNVDDAYELGERFGEEYGKWELAEEIRKILAAE